MFIEFIYFSNENRYLPSKLKTTYFSKEAPKCSLEIGLFRDGIAIGEEHNKLLIRDKYLFEDNITCLVTPPQLRKTVKNRTNFLETEGEKAVSPGLW